MNLADQYTTLKPFLFAIAYNMTGQVQEAEDIVQDAFTDVLIKQPEAVRSPKSFLTRIVMNKAIDRLGVLKKERERYPALWLPEPYITQRHGSDSTDILSYAFLHLLEALNPLERAVFILREAFDHSYEDIAELCSITSENCRQVLHRAKSKVTATPVKTMDKKESEAQAAILKEFLSACLSNDPSRLKAVLKEDVVLYSDGGGKVIAARRILSGISGVAKFIFGVVRKTFENWSASKPVLVNDVPALFMPDGEGVYMVLIPHIEEGKVVKIFMMRNPDKISFKSLSQNDQA
jgi:RNA polymerase sigma-70 factor, ECF subfamily